MHSPVSKPAGNAATRGLGLGLLAIVMFAMTLPVTRIAVGSAQAPELSGVFVASARAVLAAALSAIYLLVVRAPLPQARNGSALAMVALGVVLGFPLLTSVAMRYVQDVHASVMLGVLPLATAVVGAYLHRQRPSRGFWLCAAGGTALVVCYAWLRSNPVTIGLDAADWLLLAAMLSAAVGYGWGAQLSARMNATHVICWALLLALPINLALAWWQWPTHPIQSSAWWALGYVSVFSMWLGFFAWYRALAAGGTVRVSQLQLLQPFLSMLLAVPLLGETLDTTALGFGLAVAVLVFVGRRMPVRQI